jgi:hypothetical protein
MKYKKSQAKVNIVMHFSLLSMLLAFLLINFSSLFLKNPLLFVIIGTWYSVIFLFNSKTQKFADKILYCAIFLTFIIIYVIIFIQSTAPIVLAGSQLPPPPPGC